MGSKAARLTDDTVRPRLSLVNTFMPMDRQSGIEQDEEETPGRRLEGYVKARWTRRQGGIQKLAADIGTSTETMYAWFRGASEPNMGHLRGLADQLGVRRAVLVAVLDGDPLPGESDGGVSSGQAEAISGLVALLRPLVEQSTDGVEARLRAVEAELELRAVPTGVERPARSAPRERAG